jgi:hypothetical protein
MIESFGVHVSNPEHNITTPAKAYAELVLFGHVLTASLRRCIAEINDISPHGEDERLVNVQAQLQASANASAGVVQELLRMAIAQGLHFDLPTGDLH